MQPRNYFRAWRLYRGIKSQSELARLTIAADPKGNGISRPSILRLENFKLRWHQGHLEILSRVLNAPPGALVSVDPYNPGVMGYYLLADQRGRTRIANMIRRLARQRNRNNAA